MLISSTFAIARPIDVEDVSSLESTVYNIPDANISFVLVDQGGPIISRSTQSHTEELTYMEGSKYAQALSYGYGFGYAANDLHYAHNLNLELQRVLGAMNVSYVNVQKRDAYNSALKNLDKPESI